MQVRGILRPYREVFTYILKGTMSDWTFVVDIFSWGLYPFSPFSDSKDGLVSKESLDWNILISYPKLSLFLRCYSCSSTLNLKLISGAFYWNQMRLQLLDNTEEHIQGLTLSSFNFLSMWKSDTSHLIQVLLNLLCEFSGNSSCSL